MIRDLVVRQCLSIRTMEGFVRKFRFPAFSGYRAIEDDEILVISPEFIKYEQLGHARSQEHAGMLPEKS
jgi:hypothetical protein